MSVSYEQTGRRRQKARTRDALISAMRSLLAEGSTPTVENAAARAGISRATAYRYFPNQRALLGAAYPETEAPSLLGPDPPEEVEARLNEVVAAIIQLTFETESQLRAMLRLSLEPTPTDADRTPLRAGRRITWIADALAPKRRRLGSEAFETLVYAIAATVGIDALVWMTDVAGLPRERAAELMRWSARALLNTALREAERAEDRR